jgi:hypothetical protein
LESIKKITRSITGLWLMTRHVKVFNKSLLTGKRIAIVGPATSTKNTGSGQYIDEFDYVVRINKAPLLILNGKGKEDIGTRTDILFHSFFENDFSGGGPLDFDLYDRLGIKYVINPIPTYFGHRVTFNFYKKYLLPRNVYTLPRQPYNDMARRLGKYRATTGLCALKYLMESEFSELFITGFTFFKTGYADGYRDQMKEVEKTQKYISQMKIHNPDLEFEEFKNILVRNQEKKIIMDSTLQKILMNEKAF